MMLINTSETEGALASVDWRTVAADTHNCYDVATETPERRMSYFSDACRRVAAPDLLQLAHRLEPVGLVYLWPASN